MAFRGGTALNKLFFNPPSRYSEDIDLVQITPEPIGHTLDLIRSFMDSWMGTPRRSSSEGIVTLVYKATSDEGVPLKLKLEINTREHASVLGFKEYDFAVRSSWVEGKTTIISYSIEEILATKMRALYQRRKGRDLYDIYLAILKIPHIDCKVIVTCFKEYMRRAGDNVTGTLFRLNIEDKLLNKSFCGDIIPLLSHGSEDFHPATAYQLVKECLIDLL